MTRAPRILLSNLAPIADKEKEFFGRMVDELVARGCEVWIWSSAEINLRNATTIPFRWDLARALANEVVHARDLAPSLYRLDVEKWRPRLGQLIKQTFATEETDEILRKLACFSWKLLRDLSPDLFCVWNPNCPHMGVAADFATSLGIPTMLLERGLLPDTWFFESGGLLGASTLANQPLRAIARASLEEANALGRRYLADVSFAQFNRYPQASHDVFQRERARIEESTLRPRIVFFPPDDRSIGFTPVQGADRMRTLPRFESSADASAALARASAGPVVFKPHPSFPRPFVVSHAPPNHFVTDADFRALIEWSDVVAGSGSGLELVALICGKPVILCANEILRGKGLAYEVGEVGDLGETIRAAGENQRAAEHRENLNSFVGVMLRDHLVSLGGADSHWLTPERALAGLSDLLRFRAQAG
jgi:hypothetical protein